MPYLRFVPRLVSVPTSWGEILPVNPLRALLVVTAATSADVAWWPESRSDSNVTGFLTDSSMTRPLEFSFAEHGNLVWGPWHAITAAVAAQDHYIVEAFAPEHIMSAIRDMGVS